MSRSPRKAVVAALAVPALVLATPAFAGQTPLPGTNTLYSCAGDAGGVVSQSTGNTWTAVKAPDQGHDYIQVDIKPGTKVHIAGEVSLELRSADGRARYRWEHSVGAKAKGADISGRYILRSRDARASKDTASTRVGNSKAYVMGFAVGDEHAVDVDDAACTEG